MRLLTIAALFISACLSAGATVIDFATWGAGNGQQSWTIDDVTVTASALYRPRLDIGNAGIGISSGVLNPSPDEINLGETATISFATPVDIDKIVLQKLFSNEKFGPERGEYSVNGGSWMTFTANDPGGLLVINTSLTNVSTLAFNVPTVSGLLGSDYTVRSLDTVPEPGTFGLLGLGLAIGGLVVRKRRAS